MKPKMRRIACTCPNCKNEEKSGKSGGGIGGNKKKEHICHIPGCNKVKMLWFFFFFKYTHIQLCVELTNQR